MTSRLYILGDSSTQNTEEICQKLIDHKKIASIKILMLIIIFKIAFAPSQQPREENSCLSSACWVCSQVCFCAFLWTHHISCPDSGEQHLCRQQEPGGLPGEGSCRTAVEPAQPQPGAEHSSLTRCSNQANAARALAARY